MNTEELILRFEKLSAKRRCEILWIALDIMHQYNGRHKHACICLAMGYVLTYDEEGNLSWKKQKKDCTQLLKTKQ